MNAAATAPAWPREAPPTHGPCNGCDFEGVLFPTPASGKRSHCATCSGRAYRDNVEATRQAIRALKAAAAMGHAEAEREEHHRLVGLIGKHQADQTAAAIQAALNERPAKGGRR